MNMLLSLYFFQDSTIDELKSQCLDELLGMSSKRIHSILEGKQFCVESLCTAWPLGERKGGGGGGGSSSSSSSSSGDSSCSSSGGGDSSSSSSTSSSSL